MWLPLHITSVFTTLTFVERKFIEFAPCRPAKKNEFVDSGGTARRKHAGRYVQWAQASTNEQRCNNE
jgi:hypothetical protein